MLQLIENDDGTWTLTYFGKTVGWVNKCRYIDTGKRAYRAMSVHGELCYVSSLQWAKSRLLEMYH